MTAKEKAKELVWKFAEYSHTDFDYNNGGYQVKSQMENAKQCALIAVDEILKDKEIIDGMRVINDPYWQQVKQELEKL